MARADGKTQFGGARQETKKRFAAEYLKDLNQTKAAIRAGYAASSAKVRGCHLMKDPFVRELIDAEMAARAQRTSIDADMVVQGLARIAMKAEADRDFSAANRSYELLGKHLKLFTDKVEHGGIGGGPVVFQLTNQDVSL